MSQPMLGTQRTLGLVNLIKSDSINRSALLTNNTELYNNIQLCSEDEPIMHRVATA